MNTIQPLENSNSNYKLVSKKRKQHRISNCVIDNEFIDLSQSVRSNSVVPTGGGRKAIKDGIDMIEAKFV